MERALDFLNGNYKPVLKDLEQKMQEASEQLAFEDAIRYRDLYNSVKSVAQKQKITDSISRTAPMVRPSSRLMRSLSWLRTSCAFCAASSTSFSL